MNRAAPPPPPILLLALALVACQGRGAAPGGAATAGSAPAAAASAPSSARASSRGSASAAVASAAASAAAPTEPFAALFAGAPSPGTRRSETVFGARGVYAGLAPGWSTQDVYNAYLIAATKEARAMVYLAKDEDIEPASLQTFVDGAVYPILLKDLVWEGEWTTTEVGPSRYRARARRGRGLSIVSAKRSRVAIAVGIEVPGRSAIHVLGAWHDPAPNVERDFADLVRGVGRCVHQPKRGCVPVAPTGDETELAEPPPAAPGSEPFG